MERLKTSSVSSCNSKFTAKKIIIFRSDILCYHYWRWYWKSKVFPHIILFDKCLDHILVKFEQNRMIRNCQNFQNFELFGKQNGSPFFWESVDAILEEFLWHKQLFDASVLIESLSSFIVPKIVVVLNV